MVIKKFIAIEMGNSTYTEFLMSNLEFEETCDGIFLGIVEAVDCDDAIEKAKLLEWNLNRVFDKICVYEIKE